MNWNEAIMECRRRGFLDDDNEYVTPRRTKEQEERHDRLARFMKQNNITCDECLAFVELTLVDNVFAEEFYKELNKI